MSNLKEVSPDIEDISNQKDLGSERSTISVEDRNKFSSTENNLITILNPEASTDSNYLFFFKNGEIPENFLKSNPFIDQANAFFGKVAVLSTSIPKGAEILTFAELILEELQKLELKRITLVGFENGASIVQALTILSPRLFRRAILVDPLSRVSPGFLVRFVDWIEKYLPVGLPFRAINKDFDSRPFLHRIRCPVMVVLSPAESFYNSIESTYIAKKIPNCYLLKMTNVPLENSIFSEEFLKCLEEFQQSPAKRPQKNR
jgi:hypothetical protein